MEETITKSLLMGLAGDGLEEVLSCFQPRSFNAGEAVIRVGEDGDELFLLVAGKVRIWTGDGPAMSERTLSVMGPGDHFGEASMISGRPRTATVTALTYIETLVLKRADYRELLPKHPQLLENISSSLTRRLSEMNAVANQTKKLKRGIHSLAIVIDSLAGWALASALLGRLRQQGHIVQPIVVADGELPMELAELDSDATIVDLDVLPMEVARRSSGGSIAVAIAHGAESSSAAAKQCDRVVVAIDADQTLDSESGSIALSVPSHRRAIAALMYDGTADERPPMDDPRVRCVRVKYLPSTSGLVHMTKVDDVCVQRVTRALSGIRIGLALGGGGARGIAHVGVLDVFARHGIVFDSVAATSAGAIVGGAFSAGFTSQEIGQFFRDDMIPPKILASRAALRRAFLLYSFRGGRFEKKLRRYLHQLHFSQLDQPLAITTLDLISGTQKIRRDGDLVHSILQSINHPVFGSPIIAGQEMLVDGGVLMNVPASVLRDEGCDHVVSVDVGSTLSTDFAIDGKGNLRKPRYLSTLLRTMDISRRHSSELHGEDSDIVVIPETQDFKIEDFHAVDPLIEAGVAAGEKACTEIQQLIQRIESASG